MIPRMIKKIIYSLIIISLLSACKLASVLEGTLPTATAVPPNNTPIPATIAPTTEAAATATSALSPTSIPTAEAAADSSVTIATIKSRPPQRDDEALAVAYLGANPEAEATAVFVVTPLQVGEKQQLLIDNVDTNTISTIDAELFGVSEHAYFWFDTGAGGLVPDKKTLNEMMAGWDEIYETDVHYFGRESNPGIDGDPRVHIVHASPIALCDVTESSMEQCGLAGYFTSSNVVSTAVNPNSNVREMFIMNIQQFGTDFYLNVLAHEFRHMIEDNHDQGDADWMAEGSATLAEELNGYPDSGHYRGNDFLSNPDQQLNSWVDGNTMPYYGQGYVMNRYMFDRFGEELYREIAMSEAYSLDVIDELSAAHNLGITSEQFFLDWLTALAVHNEDNVPKLYQFNGVSLDTAAMETVSLPYTRKETVHQYAADYYALPTEGMQIEFMGETAVSLLNAAPQSGEWMWVAQRGNYSTPRLTRAVDLRDVDSATLEYDVYVDIEGGYDFAYVAVSTDGGQTWQGVIGDNMQGTDPSDDPSHTAYTDRYYTGRQQTWFHEQIDLTPYAGQDILLRYEYVTDLILTYGGLALDNISIAEIGFDDDVETVDAGWQAEGFARSTEEIPQRWPIQLVTVSDTGIEVQNVEVADGRFSLTLPPTERGNKRILIIAAIAPQTLTNAAYSLSFE